MYIYKTIARRNNQPTERSNDHLRERFFPTIRIEIEIFAHFGITRIIKNNLRNQANAHTRTHPSRRRRRSINLF